MNKLTSAAIERLKIFGECFVAHPEATKIFNDFDELRFNQQFLSDQQCMLLTGETGVGKSCLLNEYKKRNLAELNSNYDAVPVLITKISSNKGLDSTLTQILSDLELFGSEQRKKRGYRVDLSKKVVNSLKRAKVELLFINEFHDLIKFKSTQDRQIISSALKFISEEANIPIVLVGMPWISQTAEDHEWASRLVRRRELKYFSIAKDGKYFRQYLLSLSKFMPFDEPPILHTKEVVLPLFAICRGENRSLKHFLYEACKGALLAQEAGLSKNRFIQTYEKLGYEHLKENPFKVRLEEIKLSELVTNSKYNPNAFSEDETIIARKFS